MAAFSTLPSHRGGCTLPLQQGTHQWWRCSPTPPSRCWKPHSSCPESLYLLSLYDELSAAVDGGVGELGLMTLGNQGSSELQKGRNQNRDPPSPNRDEDPCLDSEDPPQLREELPRIYAVHLSSKTLKTSPSRSLLELGGSFPAGPAVHCFGRQSTPYHQLWL